MKIAIEASLENASQQVLDEFRSRGFVVYSKLDLLSQGPATVVYRFLYSECSAGGLRAVTSLNEIVRCSVVIQAFQGRSTIEIRKSERSGNPKLPLKANKLLAEISNRLVEVNTEMGAVVA